MKFFTIALLLSSLNVKILASERKSKEKQEPLNRLDCYCRCDSGFRQHSSQCSRFAHNRCSALKDLLNCNARCANEPAPYPFRAFIKSIIDRAIPN